MGREGRIKGSRGKKGRGEKSRRGVEEYEGHGRKQARSQGI
jgi:hypothetical protein